MCIGEALRGETVDVGRLDLLVAHKAVIRPRLVIGNDEDDVGWLGGGKKRGKHSKQKKYTLHGPRVQQVLPRDKHRDLRKIWTWARLTSAHPGRATFIAPEGN